VFVAMTENEMQGFLTNFTGTITLAPDAKKRREDFLRGTIEHYFEKHLYGDMPTEFGQKIAEALLSYILHEPEDLLTSNVYRFCVASDDSALKTETDETRTEIAKNLTRFIGLTLSEFRVSMNWDRRCPKCGQGIMQSQEDEDEWWSECNKCGHTDNHSIKPGFG